MTDVRLDIKLVGVEQAIIDLQAFAGDLKRSTVRRALRDASKIIVNAARAEVPPHDYGSKRRVSGTLRQNIKSFLSKIYKGASGVVGMYITVRATRKRKQIAPVTGDPFYFRFVELGHKIVRRRRRSYAFFDSLTLRRHRATQYVKAYPFLGPAYNSKGHAAIEAFNAAIIKRVAQANAKATRAAP
jgi:HK97 gp10 family phage protein